MKPIRYRCFRCGATFVAFAPAQRHAREHHGARLGMSVSELGEATQ